MRSRSGYAATAAESAVTKEQKSQIKPDTRLSESLGWLGSPGDVTRMLARIIAAWWELQYNVRTVVGVVRRV